MSKKQILLIFGGIVIIVIIIIVLTVLSKKSGSKITIQTSNGSVAIKDYTKSAVQELPSTTVIVDANTFVIDNLHGSNPIGSTNSFHILIEAKPVTEIRQQAEQAFLNSLQISQNDACKLNVYLQVANSVDPSLSGINWGLSFCPNGVAFPKSSN